MAAVISGVVRGPGGKAVANARIAFAAAPVAVPDVAALTGSNGAFALSAPAPGRYVVQCFAQGFRPASVTVDVKGPEPVHVDIQLAQDDAGAA